MIKFTTTTTKTFKDGHNQRYKSLTFLAPLVIHALGGVVEFSQTVDQLLLEARQLLFLLFLWLLTSGMKQPGKPTKCILLKKNRMDWQKRFHL